MGPAYQRAEMVSPQTPTTLCPLRFRITVHGPPSRVMAADLRKGVRRRLRGLTWCFSGYRPQGGLRPGRQALRGAMAHANGPRIGQAGLAWLIAKGFPLIAKGFGRVGARSRRGFVCGRIRSF